jgi:hypothetical protein
MKGNIAKRSFSAISIDEQDLGLKNHRCASHKITQHMPYNHEAN